MRRRKSSRRSCRDSNSQPFDHESGTIIHFTSSSCEDVINIWLVNSSKRTISHWFRLVQVEIKYTVYSCSAWWDGHGGWLLAYRSTNLKPAPTNHRVIIYLYVSSRDSLLVRAPDSWSKGTYIPDLLSRLSVNTALHFRGVSHVVTF